MLPRVISQYVSLLAGSRTQSDHPMIWLDQVRILLSFTQVISKQDQAKVAELKGKGVRLTMLPGKQRPLILNEVSRTRNSVLAAYVRLEELAPTPFSLSERLPPQFR